MDSIYTIVFYAALFSIFIIGILAVVYLLAPDNVRQEIHDDLRK